MATIKIKSMKKNSAFAPFLPYGKSIKELIGEGQLVEVFSEENFAIAFTKELLEDLNEGCKRYHIDALVGTRRGSFDFQILCSNFKDPWGRKLHAEDVRIRSWNKTIYMLGYQGNFDKVDALRDDPSLDPQMAKRINRILSKLGVA